VEQTVFHSSRNFRQLIPIIDRPTSRDWVNRDISLQPQDVKSKHQLVIGNAWKEHRARLKKLRQSILSLFNHKPDGAMTLLSLQIRISFAFTHNYL
jgi:hypothetical protein